MTGRELIEWIQDNHAEDFDVVLDVQCEYTYAQTIENPTGTYQIIIS